MGRQPAEGRRVRPDRLAVFAAEVLAAVGVPSDDAAFVADCLVQAELWGHPSHGLLRLGWYVARIRSGVVDPAARPETVVDRGAVAVVDGREGLGHVLAAAAAREAVRRAKEHGVGVVAVRNSNHFGMSAHYTRLMADAGCVGVLTTNSSPSMAPWGGRAKTLGANPWSVAAPAGAHGVAVVDISNGNVARGKIYAARERGVQIPAGWAIDARGAPTTDPAAALSGLLLPMAGHKGYAIAFMMDVLSGVLTGSSFGTGVSGPQQAERRSGCGHLVLALDVEAFLPLGEFNRRMERLIQEVKSVPPAKGFDEVFYPGEVEDRSRARLEREGIDLPAGTFGDLERLADQLGVLLDRDQAAPETSPPMVLRSGELDRFDRGAGVVTLPYVGKWNAEGNRVTTGITVFEPGTAIPLHTHNVEENVLVLEGEATAVVGEDSFELKAGDATWVPEGVPHRFANRGQSRLRIYWVYGGREVTRTIVATGETFEHLSEADRWAIRSP